MVSQNVYQDLLLSNLCQYLAQKYKKLSCYHLTKNMRTINLLFYKYYVTTIVITISRCENLLYFIH